MLKPVLLHFTANSKKIGPPVCLGCQRNAVEKSQKKDCLATEGGGCAPRRSHPVQL
jgi:hypothetical protein